MPLPGQPSFRRRRSTGGTLPTCSSGPYAGTAPPSIQAPAACASSWYVQPGVRYGITVVFEDDTWIWTDMAANLDEAIRSIQRLSAERDKPIRQLGDDEQLKAAGY